MSLESTSSRCEQAARHLMVFGRSLTTEEIVRGVEAVDDAAVRRVVNRLVASRPTLTGLGPISALPDLDTISRRLAP